LYAEILKFPALILSERRFQKMKYYDGKQVIEVVVSKEVEAGFKELQREEARSDKSAERHQAAISLT